MKTDAATLKRVYAMSLAGVYPHYVAKAEKKGRTKAEVDQIIRWLTLVSMLSAVNALTLMAPRVLFALGDHGISRVVRRVDERGTPTVALAISTVVTLAFIATGTVQAVIALAAFFFVANYTLSFLSVFVLRRREPELARPYRAWGYPWTTGIVLAGSLAFLAAAVSADTRNALYSIALLALSYPVYRVLSQRITAAD